MLLKEIKTPVKKTVLWASNIPLVQNLLQRYHRNKIIFLAYHGISMDSEPYQAWTLVRENNFFKQMRFLKKYDCLSIDDAINYTKAQSKQPGIVITFDDGYANNYNIALPILESLQIPAIIYITTQHALERKLFWSDKVWIAAKRSKLDSVDLRFIDQQLGIYSLIEKGNNWDEQVLNLLEDIKKTAPGQRSKIVEQIVIELTKSSGSTHFHVDVENNVFTPLSKHQIHSLANHPLITIGAHSHCHNLLDQIPLEMAKDSILKSKKILEDITGLHINHFAYPNGNFNLQLMRIIEALSFSSAVTFQPGFYKKGDTPFAINRIGIGADTSLDLFMAFLTGVLPLKKRLFY